MCSDLENPNDAIFEISRYLTEKDPLSRGAYALSMIEVIEEEVTVMEQREGLMSMYNQALSEKLAGSRGVRSPAENQDHADE